MVHFLGLVTKYYCLIAPTEITYLLLFFEIELETWYKWVLGALLYGYSIKAQSIC